MRPDDDAVISLLHQRIGHLHRIDHALHVFGRCPSDDPVLLMRELRKIMFGYIQTVDLVRLAIQAPQEHQRAVSVPLHVLDSGRIETVVVGERCGEDRDRSGCMLLGEASRRQVQQLDLVHVLVAGDIRFPRDDEGLRAVGRHLFLQKIVAFV